MPRKNSKITDPPTGNSPGRRVTDEEWEIFFQTVVTSGGNVTRACERIKLSRMAVYEKRHKDPAFAERLLEAEAAGADALEDEATRRAFEGVQEPVGFFQGVSYETRTVYSDSLIQFLLKGKKPNKYRERVSTENVNVDVTPEDGDAVRNEILRKLNGGKSK